MKKQIILMGVLIIALATVGIVSAVEQPLIKTTLVNYDPAPAQPGDVIDLWIRLENEGTQLAKNIEVEFMDNYPFSLTKETERIEKISVLDAGESYLIKYTVRVDNKANPGNQNVLVKYNVGSQITGDIIKTISLEIMTSDTPVSINNVNIEPETLKPGSKSKLTISVKNLARTTVVRDISVTLQLNPVVSATSVLIDLPFVPISSGSQKTLDALKPGQSADFEFEIATYPDAEARLYKIPVTIAYTDDAGTTTNKTVLVGVEVNTKPEIMAAIDSSTINTNLLSGEVIFSITNKGITDVKLMTLRLGDGNNYEIESTTNEVYVGNIDSDDFETASFDIRLKEAKSTTLPITIEYKDALNNEYTETFELALNVREPGSSGGSSAVITAIVIIIIAIIVFIIYRRSKNRKKRRN